MALLVVPLAADETDLLTHEEWDRLTRRERVFFEDSNHPLVERVRAAGVSCEFSKTPDPGDGKSAAVMDPSSNQLVALAHAGAQVTAGQAASVDSLTAAHAAPVLRQAGEKLSTLVAIMARLRSADGCPWDREQSHESLRVHLLEETYEVLDTIERGSLGDDLKEELGDLLLQVVFHSQLAADDDRFDVATVAQRIAQKLLHRHPHVFGQTRVSGADEVVSNWEAIKADEKGRGDPFEGIPAALPALLAAYKVQKRAAALGFSGEASEARRRLAEATASEEPSAQEVGEALFWLVALARAKGVDPEGALRAATAAFRSSL
jgi:MazG family protein